MAEDNGVHERMKLDASDVVEAEIEIVGYMSGDGKMQMRFRCEADVSHATCMGLLDQAKSLLVMEWLREEND